MPLTIPAGDAQVEYHIRGGTDPEDMMLTLGARAVAGPFGPLHVQALESAFRDSVLTLLSANYLLARTVARVRQDGGDDIVLERTPATTALGSAVGTVLPPNNALLARKITARGGKRGRGRWYIPGMVESNYDDNGLMSAANVLVFDNEFTDYLNLLATPAAGGGSAVIPLLFHNNTTTTTVSETVGSRTVTTTQGAAGPSPDVITSIRADPRLATQRRRLRP